MGAFDKQKREIKRELKRQRTDMGKAKKLAEALLTQLKGVEGRFDQTEQVLDELPGNDIENVFKQLRDRRDTPQAKVALQTLANRLTKSGNFRPRAGQSIGHRVAKRAMMRRGGLVTFQLGAGRASKASSKAGSRATKASSKPASNKSTAKEGRKAASSGAASSIETQSDFQPDIEEEEKGSNDEAEEMEQD